MSFSSDQIHKTREQMEQMEKTFLEESAAREKTNTLQSGFFQSFLETWSLEQDPTEDIDHARKAAQAFFHAKNITPEQERQTAKLIKDLDNYQAIINSRKIILNSLDKGLKEKSITDSALQVNLGAANVDKLKEKISQKIKEAKTLKDAISNPQGQRNKIPGLRNLPTYHSTIGDITNLQGNIKEHNDRVGQFSLEVNALTPAPILLFQPNLTNFTVGHATKAEEKELDRVEEAIGNLNQKIEELEKTIKKLKQLKEGKTYRDLTKAAKELSNQSETITVAKEKRITDNNKGLNIIVSNHLTDFLNTEKQKLQTLQEQFPGLASSETSNLNQGFDYQEVRQQQDEAFQKFPRLHLPEIAQIAQIENICPGVSDISESLSASLKSDNAVREQARTNWQDRPKEIATLLNQVQMQTKELTALADTLKKKPLQDSTFFPKEDDHNSSKIPSLGVNVAQPPDLEEKIKALENQKEKYADSLKEHRRQKDTVQKMLEMEESARRLNNMHRNEIEDLHTDLKGKFKAEVSANLDSTADGKASNYQKILKSYTNLSYFLTKLDIYENHLKKQPDYSAALELSKEDLPTDINEKDVKLSHKIKVTQDIKNIIKNPLTSADKVIKAIEEKVKEKEVGTVLNAHRDSEGGKLFEILNTLTFGLFKEIHRAFRKSEGHKVLKDLQEHLGGGPKPRGR